MIKLSSLDRFLLLYALGKVHHKIGNTFYDLIAAIVNGGLREERAKEWLAELAGEADTVKSLAP